MSVHAIASGTCAACGQPWQPGDDIEIGPGGWSHPACASPATRGGADIASPIDAALALMLADVPVVAMRVLPCPRCHESRPTVDEFGHPWCAACGIGIPA